MDVSHHHQYEQHQHEHGATLLLPPPLLNAPMVRHDGLNAFELRNNLIARKLAGCCVQQEVDGKG